MGSLANKTIASTYDGLVKTSTEDAVPASGQQLLQDGTGNSLALSVGRANNGATITGSLTAGGLSYPTSDGTAGQVLSTDGAGNLTFADGGGGAFGFTYDVSNQVTLTGVDYQIPFPQDFLNYAAGNDGGYYRLAVIFGPNPANTMGAYDWGYSATFNYYYDGTNPWYNSGAVAEINDPIWMMPMIYYNSNITGFTVSSLPASMDTVTVKVVIEAV